MRFDVLTIFPRMFDSYFRESILKRAQKKKLIKVKVWNLRDFTTDKHQKVDDKPYGGGPGMVMKVEPFYRALLTLKVTEERGKSRYPLFNSKGERDPAIEAGKGKRVILLSAKGKIFTQKDAARLAKYKRLVLLCGRYEGVDERVASHLADEEISIGNYVLTGGELPAMVIVDAVSRHIPGVLGKAESLEERRKKFQIPDSKFQIPGLGYPQYTRPEIFSPTKGARWSVPKVLLSGDHKKIAGWRGRKSKQKPQ